MGMLDNQTQVLKQHAEILNENQKNIAKILNNNLGNSHK